MYTDVDIGIDTDVDTDAHTDVHTHVDTDAHTHVDTGQNAKVCLARCSGARLSSQHSGGRGRWISENLRSALST